jgi:ABC-type Fe3+-hydroxamate transport system substrate-binding protein
LVPSVTETLLGWGVTPVGVTRFCEAPGVRTVGGTKNPDLTAIADLAPDVVVMDKEENRAADADALHELGLTVHATHVRSVDDVAPMLAALGAAVGCVAPEQSLMDPLGGPDSQLPSRCTAWIPIWRRPWMSISGATYGSTLLAAAGIDNVCETAAEPYPTMSLAEAAGCHPDVVLVPSEPYPFKERHRAELESVAPVVFVDGQDLFWWGVRTPAALRRLRKLAAGLRGRQRNPGQTTEPDI